MYVGCSGYELGVFASATPVFLSFHYKRGQVYIALSPLLRAEGLGDGGKTRHMYTYLFGFMCLKGSAED